MQCSSFTPVYYHARDLKNGYSYDLVYDSNGSYGEEGDHNPCMLLSQPNLGYDKEVLKRIIQNHEATFRCQVEELHRLHRRQRDLMDEMRMREIFAHNLLLSRASIPPATNWLFGNLQKPAMPQTDMFVRRNSNNGVHFLSPGCKQNGNEIVNLDMCHDDRGKLFKAGNASGSGLDIGSIKTWDLSNSSSNVKMNCFFDLNKPIELESLPASSSGPLEASTGRNETIRSDDGVNLQAIDLNCMPVNCFSEQETTLNSPGSMKMKCCEDEISYRFLKSETCIDLNSGVGDEIYLPIKSSEDTEVKGPVSPENEESSPPRGKSEDTQGEGESLIGLDAVAAHTLVEILSSAKFRNLCWFAEFVSSTGDKEVMNDEDEENVLTNKVKGKKGKKQLKELQTESPTSLSKDVKRKLGRNGSAKSRICSKLSHSDVTKKSMSSILKQSARRMDHDILQRWGTTNKRQGDRRRKASYSFSLAQ